jgi:hypothetical protein
MSVSSVTAYKPPDIPSKWDIIPIHNSDRTAFRDCRRRWDWSSPARHNLTLRADIHGVNHNLWFGTGIHWAIEQYYTPGIRRDPVEAWRTWFDIQWRGGVVTEEWLDKVYDLKPRLVSSESPSSYLTHAWVPTDDKPTPGRTYIVRGLEDILPYDDTEKFEELYELGVNMMIFYREYAEKNDDFEVILNEHQFSVPIWDYENNCILMSVDKREDSPNCGKLLEVHSRGRVDNVYIKPEQGKLGIIDSKTAAKIGEEYFAKLEADEQCTSYLWALEVEANYYDLPHKGEPLEEVVYNTLRKAYPKPPTELRNGMFSIDRENESCTYDILQEWIKRNMPGVPLSEKQQNYVDWLKDVGDEQFIIRKSVRRNRHQIANAGKRLYLEALDMLSDPLIYPNLNNSWSCRNCVFRAPCLAKEDGSDWQQLIKDNYASNRDR